MVNAKPPPSVVGEAPHAGVTFCLTRSVISLNLFSSLSNIGLIYLLQSKCKIIVINTSHTIWDISKFTKLFHKEAQILMKV